MCFMKEISIKNQLLINPGNENSWININLEGETSNNAAIGAKIYIVTSNDQNIYRTISSGASFGANNYSEHIGLDNADKISSLEITWPKDGQKTTFQNLDVNQYIKVSEGKTNILSLKESH